MKAYAHCFRRLAAVLCLSLFGLGAGHAATVDLLVTYDGHSERHFGGEVDAAMQNWVSQVNDIYSNSGVDVQLRLAGTMRRDIHGSDMGEVLGNIRVDDAINQRRDEVGADFVTQLHSTGACGVGYVAVHRDWAFNVTGPGCGAQVLAHELGHNMGLSHSRKQGDDGGARYRYALGHGVDGVFATTMAYPGVFHTDWVANFSNPRVNCRGLACGVWPGNQNEADAAQALNNVRGEIADFLEPPQPTTFVLRAQHSNRCLDVYNWSTQNGANVIQWDCHGGDNQRFRILDAGDGYWMLQNVHSGKCLDVAAYSQDAGGNIHQWDCHGGDNQRIKARNLGGNLHHLAFRISGMCMDIAGADQNRGASAIQWHCHSGENQRFYLDPM